MAGPAVIRFGSRRPAEVPAICSPAGRTRTLPLRPAQQRSSPQGVIAGLASALFDAWERRSGPGGRSACPAPGRRYGAC